MTDGQGLVARQINGQTVYGTDGSDGSFLSRDGTTYVKPDGQVETGITDQATGQFLPNGTSYTLPSGTVLYGYMDAGTFYSYDGSTIVLNNGTAVTGTLDKSTGIFTGSNGKQYFIGQNAVVPVTKQSDGSYVEGDGSVIMTAQSWSVDLLKFSDSMQAVKGNGQAIVHSYELIRAQFDTVEEVWVSPAGTSFGDVTSAIDAAMGRLNMVVDSIYAAMQSSYNNYQAEEQTNAQNFTGS